MICCSHISIPFCLILGLSPTDSYDEAAADMITDGCSDMLSAMAKMFFEKDESKKVLCQLCHLYPECPNQAKVVNTSIL